MELRGRSVLVTGATGGLGQAIARRLRAEGCVLTLTGRRGDVLDGARRVSSRGRPSLLTSPSVGDLQRVVDAVRTSTSSSPTPGCPGLGSSPSTPSSSSIGCLTSTFGRPLALARLLGERMLARGHGHVVFISSLSGKTANPVVLALQRHQVRVRGFALASAAGLGASWSGGVLCQPRAHRGRWDVPRGLRGVALPAGFRPKTPGDVAAAVVRAVKNDRAEVDVADPVMRAGVVFGQVAPQAAAKLNRLAGADRLSQQLADGTVDKR